MECSIAYSDTIFFDLVFNIALLYLEMIIMKEKTNHMNHLQLLLDLMRREYKVSMDYNSIDEVNIKRFEDRITDLSNHDVMKYEDGMYYPIMEPLVQSSLAHLLYILKHNIEFSSFKGYNPNDIRFRCIENLVHSKAHLTLCSIKFLTISPSTTSIDREKLMRKVNDLLKNPILHGMVEHFTKKLQIEGNQFERILDYQIHEKDPTRGLGELYFILMDLYLEFLDYIVLDTIKKSGCNAFWWRCTNTAVMGYLDKQSALKLKRSLPLSEILSVWGLTAKVSSGTSGGRILRPFKGMLYLTPESHIQWERPSNLIEV